LLAFIGQGAGDALDVGCGEGRVSRVLKECGYRVTAVDPVEKLISAAEQARSADAYRIAAAADLPFENCSFDLAVAYNVLMDIEGSSSSAEGNQASAASLGNPYYFDCAPLCRSRSLRWSGAKRSVRA
jgi:SAM-dependent methyltransferase